ncbi:hypothetical protein ACFMQL_20275 [Nonomuraea fastidiosa]|uniref:hypothetical protein n=1 Tax=Nonomuraea fastidiosa TaxID=46173 RepID=UPI003671F7AC
MTAATANLPAIASWSVPDRLRYAEELANSGLLPDSFRKQPANMFWAVEFGISVGIDPIVAATEVHVIKGKVAPSSALMSALVRKAGHRLRVWVERDETGNPIKAVATIVRHDDPEFEFRSEWTVARAQRSGLLRQNENYGKFTEQMLKARAIGEVARDACKEALLGMGYLPEELGAVVNEDGSVVVTDATVEAGTSVRAAAAAAKEATGVVMASNKKLKDLAALMDANGITDKLGYIRDLFPDHEFNSAADLTAAQADQVANAINRRVNLPRQDQDADEAHAQTAPAAAPAEPEADDAPTQPADGDNQPVEGDVVEDEPATKDQLRELGILMTETGITPHTGRGSTKANDQARFAWLSNFLGVPVGGSTKNLNRGQAQAAIEELKRVKVERAKRRAALYRSIDESFTRLGITAAEDRLRDLSDLIGRPIMNPGDLTYDEVEQTAELLEQALETEQPVATWDTMLQAAKQANQAAAAEQQNGGA